MLSGVVCGRYSTIAENPISAVRALRAQSNAAVPVEQGRLKRALANYDAALPYAPN
jgi:hypothetical protein